MSNPRSTGPTHRFEDVSVKQAEALLGRNDTNRNLRKTKVDQYTRDMQSGNWGLCPAPIVIDTKGQLIDGQHRLTAQVRAGMKMKWLVLRNVDPDAQRYIDTGASRSPADHLHFMGESNPGPLATTLRLAHKVVSGTLSGKVGETVSTSEIIDMLEKEPVLKHSLDVSMQANRKRMTPLSPSVLAVAHWLITQANDLDEADAFITRIGTLTAERDGSPILALNRRVNELRRQNVRVTTREYLALVIKAWNYDAVGQKVNKMALHSRTGEYVLPNVAKRKVNAFVIEDIEDDKDELVADGEVEE